MAKKVYLRFVPIPNPGRRTEIWDVHSVRGFRLGTILWRGGWRQYVFEPDADTVWSDGCMVEVQTKIRSLMEARRVHPV